MGRSIDTVYLACGMSRVVVTGGFGYVGGRLVQTLLSENFEPRGVTRRGTAQVPGWARDSVVWGNDLERLCEGADALIHLAAPNETATGKDPERAIHDTVELTRHAINAASKAGVRRFIYFSTVHVYGPLSGTITETTAPVPVSPYAVAHRLSEELIEADAGTDMPALVLRLTNGFGAPADDGAERWTLLVNDLCRQAVREAGLTLTSPGLQWRDFIPLTDVTAAAVRFLGAWTPPAPFNVINLSRGTSLTVRQMAERILDRARSLIDPSLQLHAPATNEQPENPPLVIANDTLRRSGFNPTADFDAEIDGLLTFCKQAFGAKT